MSSTRLPGKVLMPLAGAPMILRQIERVARARRIDRLVVATSVDTSDDQLAAVVKGAGVAVHRGPLDDVLARFIGALDACGPAEHVVRLTGDCPPRRSGGDRRHHRPRDRRPRRLRLQHAGASHVSQGPRRRGDDPPPPCAPPPPARPAPKSASTSPGACIAIPSFNRQAWFSQAVDEGEVRWTVDVPADYAFVSAVYDALYAANPAFASDDVRDFVRGRPDLAMLGGARRV